MKPVAERHFYGAYPLRSHKYVITEGGIRVPFIVSGPGIPTGVSSKTPVVAWDIFPTVLEMAGAKAQVPENVEGGSLLPLCTSGGEAEVERRLPFMIFRSDLPKGGRFTGVLDVALIQNRYKFYRELESGNEFLWSLEEDMGESKNLISELPELASRLRKTMDDYCVRVGWDQRERAPDIK